MINLFSSLTSNSSSSTSLESATPRERNASGSQDVLETKSESKDSKDFVVIQKEQPSTLLQDKLLSDPKSLSTVLGSVFVPGKTYRFRLTRTAVLSTSGAGALAIATAVYPQQFSEYMALVGLFKEARLRSSKIRYVGIGASSNAFISSFDPSYASGGSPSFTSALNQVGAQLWNLNVVNVKRENRYRIRGLRPWSAISSTASGFDPYGGVCGAWYTVIQGTGPISTDVLVYTIEADYEFRNPQ